MSMQMSYGAMKLLKVTITSTGEKETDQQGQEVMAARRLNGEDSSQRRHFIKAIKEWEEGRDVIIRDIATETQKKLEEMKAALKVKFTTKTTDDTGKEVETVDHPALFKAASEDKEIEAMIKDANKRIDDVQHQKGTFEILPKTKDVLKKYFELFGNEAGFGSGDDEYVEELTEALK